MPYENSAQIPAVASPGKTLRSGWGGRFRKNLGAVKASVSNQSQEKNLRNPQRDRPGPRILKRTREGILFVPPLAEKVGIDLQW